MNDQVPMSPCPCGCDEAGHLIVRHFPGKDCHIARVRCRKTPDHGACSRLVSFENEEAMMASPAYAGDLCYVKELVTHA